MADTLLQDFTETTAPSDGDLLYTVVDPSGTPADRKITWTSIKTFLSNVFLKLNQSTPQTIVGRAIHQDGIKLGTTPTVGTFEDGKMYYDAANKTISAMVSGDVDMQIGQEELVLCYNNTGSTILNGKCVYPTGANGDLPTISLAKADNETTAKVLGIATQDILDGESGLVNVRGIVHNVDTSTFTAGQELYLSPTVAGEYTATMPTDTTHYVVRIGRALLINATTGSVYVRQVLNNRLTDLNDVSVSTPLIDQVIKYNGSEWINGPQTSSSAGAGISFFLDDTAIIPAGAGPQTVPVNTLSKTPITTSEVIDTVTVNNNTLLIERYLYDNALGGTQIDGGIWTFNHYCLVNNTLGVTTIPVTIRKVVTGTGTITITGTGTTRTATITGSTPFVSGDANADITLNGLVQTPNGCFGISAFTSSSVVSITTPSTYTNESGVAFSIHKFLFSDANTEVNNTAVGLVTSYSAQPSFAINATDKLSASYYARTEATTNRNVSLYHNGTDHYTYFTTPLVTRHNDLAGLQGGTGGEYNHLTNAQLTVVQNTSGTNTGDQTISDATISLTDVTTNNASASKHGFLPKLENTGTKYLRDDGTWVTVSSGGSSLWTAVAGNPTRVSNTQFTVTDTGNTAKLDLLLSRLTCIKWTESSVLKQAMVVSATYATNTVTINIIGDTLTSIDANSMKYFAQKASFYKFAYAGGLGATGSNVMNKVKCEVAGKIFGLDFWCDVAGSGTTTIDLNKNGNTLTTTKASITTTNDSVFGVTADNGSVTAVGDYLTIDVDAVAGTIIQGGYINVFYIPLYNSYLS